MLIKFTHKWKTFDMSFPPQFIKPRHVSLFIHACAYFSITSLRLLEFLLLRCTRKKVTKLLKLSPQNVFERNILPASIRSINIVSWKCEHCTTASHILWIHSRTSKTFKVILNCFRQQDTFCIQGLNLVPTFLSPRYTF